MTERKYILNDQDEPVICYETREWLKWFRKQEPIETKIGKVIVSTVFLGLNMSPYSFGKPILWETLIINGSLEGYCERYGTKQEALEGHMRAVGLVNAEREGIT